MESGQVNEVDENKPLVKVNLRFWSINSNGHKGQEIKKKSAMKALGKKYVPKSKLTNLQNWMLTCQEACSKPPNHFTPRKCSKME